MLILVQDENGNGVSVNPDHIVTIEADATGRSSVTLSNGRTLYFPKSKDDVMSDVAALVAEKEVTP